jgi:hypothetical protein
MTPTTRILVLVFLLALVPSCANGQTNAKWQKEVRIDTLRDTSFVEFQLDGKFLTPPSKSGPDSPKMVFRCDPAKKEKDRFIEGFVHVGTVVESENPHVLGLVTSTPVNIRFDDGKVLSRSGIPSTNGQGVFFRSWYFKRWLNFIKARHHKVVMAVPEFLGGDVVMQFDIPADSKDVEDSCGLGK